MGLYDITVGLISLIKEGKDVHKIQAISRNYIIQTLFLNMDKEMENNFFVKKKNMRNNGAKGHRLEQFIKGKIREKIKICILVT